MSSAPLDVLLPQLAMGMAEASIVEWLVAEGAAVTRDQPLVSIETEKVVTELPAPVTVSASRRWRLSEIREWIEAGCPCQREWELNRPHFRSC